MPTKGGQPQGTVALHAGVWIGAAGEQGLGCRAPALHHGEEQRRGPVAIATLDRHSGIEHDAQNLVMALRGGDMRRRSVVIGLRARPGPVPEKSPGDVAVAA